MVTTSPITPTSAGGNSIHKIVDNSKSYFSKMKKFKFRRNSHDDDDGDNDRDADGDNGDDEE